MRESTGEYGSQASEFAETHEVGPEFGSVDIFEVMRRATCRELHINNPAGEGFLDAFSCGAHVNRDFAHTQNENGLARRGSPLRVAAVS